MPLAEATSLCPHDLQVHPYDLQKDLEQLQQLAIFCERFSPRTGLECTREHFFRTGNRVTDHQPQSLLIDVTGTSALFGSEQQMVRQLILDFHRQGYSVRLAIAATLGAAWALAHFSPPQKPPGTESWFATFPAPGNSHHDRTSWAWILATQQTSDGLEKLPPAALRIPLKTINQLRQAGIQDIATLSQLPRTSLLDRLGKVLLKRMDQAFGNTEEHFDTYHSPADFSIEHWLEHPTTNPRIIERIMLDSLETLTQRLTQHSQGILQLECHLQSVEKEHFQTNICLFQATTDSQHLSALWKMQWEHQSLCSPIQEIKMVAARTAPLESYQRDLFDPLQSNHSCSSASLPASRQHSNKRRLAHLIDRLSRRLGTERVLQSHLQADSQPERAYQNISWVGSTGHSKNRHSPHNASCSRKQSGDTPSTRPLQLLSPPPQLTVTAIAFDGSPIRFKYRHDTYQVDYAWGPERIETGWWRGPGIRRDYYRVQTTTGHCFWLFRELHHNHWHLHGEFI